MKQVWFKMKQEYKNQLKEDISLLIETSKDIISLKETMIKFRDDPYCKGSERLFNENGDFVSQLNVDSSILSEFEDDEARSELIAQLTEQVDCVYILNYSGNWVLEQYLGEAVTINFSDTRNCYAIHSIELGLKVNYRDLIGDDDSEKLNHGKLIIEKAMRKHGYFPNIVELDYYGQVLKEVSTDLGTLSDEELKERIKTLESEVES